MRLQRILRSTIDKRLDILQVDLRHEIMEDYDEGYKDAVVHEKMFLEKLIEILDNAESEARKSSSST
jgi:hypothetical protein